MGEATQAMRDAVEVPPQPLPGLSSRRFSEGSRSSQRQRHISNNIGGSATKRPDNWGLFPSIELANALGSPINPPPKNSELASAFDQSCEILSAIQPEARNTVEIIWSICGDQITRSLSPE